jgi:hypothetical protein
VYGDGNEIASFSTMTALTVSGLNDNTYIAGGNADFTRRGDGGITGINVSGFASTVIEGNQGTLWLGAHDAFVGAFGDAGYYQLSVAANLNLVVEGNGTTTIASATDIIAQLQGYNMNAVIAANDEAYGRSYGNGGTQVILGGQLVSWFTSGDGTNTTAAGNTVDIIGIGDGKTMEMIGSNVNATLYGDAGQFTAIGTRIDAFVDGNGDVVDLTGRDVSLTMGGTGDSAIVHGSNSTSVQLAGTENYVYADGDGVPGSFVELDLWKGTGNTLIANGEISEIVDEGVQGGNYLQGGGEVAYVFGGGNPGGAGDVLVSTAKIGVLNGGGGNDVLINNGGKSMMIGGSGSDIYFARDGSFDTIELDGASMFGAHTAQLVAGFTPGEDTLGVNLPNGQFYDLSPLIEGMAGWVPQGAGQIAFSLGQMDVDVSLANPYGQKG